MTKRLTTLSILLTMTFIFGGYLAKYQLNTAQNGIYSPDVENT